MRGFGEAIRSLLANRGLIGKRVYRTIDTIDPETGSPRPGREVEQAVRYIMWEPNIYRDAATSGFEDFVRQNGGRVHIVATDRVGFDVEDFFEDNDGARYKVRNVLRYPAHEELLVVRV